MVDFSAYLEAICNNSKYTQYRETYTVTDVVTRRGERPFAPTDGAMRSLPGLLDLGLMVQTVPKQEERENREEKQEKIEKFSILEGLRKYAANHVLLRENQDRVSRRLWFGYCWKKVKNTGKR